MLEDANDLVAMAEALVRSGEYRVLRRLVPRKISDRRIALGCTLATSAFGSQVRNAKISMVTSPSFIFLTLVQLV